MKHVNLEEGEISLKEVILKIKKLYHYLVSRWLAIVLAGIIGGILGFVYALNKKPVYKAITTFVLEEDGGAGLGGQYGGLASIAGIDLGSGQSAGIFQGNNILELYKSRAMVQKALLSQVDIYGKRDLLIHRYIEINKLRQKWASRPELKNIKFENNEKQPFSRLQDSVLGVIVKEINGRYLSVIKPDETLSIIRAEVKAEDEFFAKAFNEQIVQTVNNFYIQTKTKKALQNLEIIQHQTDSVRAAMNQAMYSTAAVSDATPNLNPARQILRVPAQRSQFNAEANKVMLTQLVQNLEMAKISIRKDAPLIQIIDSPIFPLEKGQISRIRAAMIGGGILIVLAIITVSFRMFLRIILQ